MAGIPSRSISLVFGFFRKKKLFAKRSKNSIMIKRLRRAEDRMAAYVMLLRG
jgi:hypothetical protein